MKPFLLIAGDNYYPSAYTDDWIESYTTYQDAKNAVSLSGDKIIINNRKYDWFDIVDLREWIYPPHQASK